LASRLWSCCRDMKHTVNFVSLIAYFGNAIWSGNATYIPSHEQMKATSSRCMCFTYTYLMKKTSQPFLKGNFEGYNFHSIHLFMKLDIPWKRSPLIRTYVKVGLRSHGCQIYVHGLQCRWLYLRPLGKIKGMHYLLSELLIDKYNDCNHAFYKNKCCEKLHRGRHNVHPSNLDEMHYLDLDQQ